MCTLATAAGCIECRVIWKRKSRWRPGCIGFMHGHVLENALKMCMLGDRQQQGTRGEEAWLQVSNTYDETRKQQTYKHKHKHEGN